MYENVLLGRTVVKIYVHVCCMCAFSETQCIVPASMIVYIYVCVLCVVCCVLEVVTGVDSVVLLISLATTVRYCVCECASSTHGR